MTAAMGTRERLAATVFRMICARNHQRPANLDEEYFQERLLEAPHFFARFGGRLDLRGKAVLDMGSGYGASCFYMALEGAKRVVGVDIDENRLAFSRDKLAHDYAGLSGVVEFRPPATGDRGEKFDVILSQNSFQHYDDPEGIIEQLTERLNPGGIMAIAFGPLWKSPHGGPIEFMTPVPWAHLIFPERVIMRERRRFRPDEAAETFADIRGGLNKMTLGRYVRIIEGAGLRFRYFRTNVAGGWMMPVFRLIRQLPFLREYFTVNVYSIVGRPE